MIVPSTMKKGQEGKFYLSVYGDSSFQIERVDKEDKGSHIAEEEEDVEVCQDRKSVIIQRLPEIFDVVR
jgi:hypothetical protein